MSDRNTKPDPDPQNNEAEPHAGKPRDHMGFISIENMEDQDLDALSGRKWNEEDEANDEVKSWDYRAGPSEDWESERRS